MIEDSKLIHFTYRGTPLKIVADRYVEGGAIALLAVSDDVFEEPWAKLTVNLEGFKPKLGQVLIKTWSENEELTNRLRDSEFFQDTLDFIPVGMNCMAEIWEIRVPYDKVYV